ncbi:Stk1 family PASTA domain-containing Ser/Thr kinase [Bacillus sp. DJP31]|uniref:Stk1 family PASTA domain-containing Ser/Thr kinase n=1 Tax=Bacillus sp. DJP31 TaxID=3409789 RepID=UPI003BB5ED44
MIGRRLSGRYKVIDAIGGGGMANVYLARDMILDRDVAVKVLRPDFSDDQEFIRRFHREAQSATSLNHPNIVSIYDVGEEDRIFYIVMELIEGTTLKQYIQKYGPLSNEESVNIMLQLTSAIANAHENQIVHRDIKPQNILIDENGVVKVTDFGIAVALSSTTITQTNSFLGSVHYLSPEQARGGMATKKSDIYSLGIVMFELITGRLPFFGESAVSIALKHLQNETPSPKRWNPSLPQSLENIILKSTAKDTFHRYDSIEAMEVDLRTSLEPRRLHEAPFKVPQLEGDVTKAIPIITNEKMFENNNSDETIVHSDKKKEEPKKKNRGKKIAIWVITIFFLLAAAGVASITIIPSLFMPGDVTVPDVTNEDYRTAYNELDTLGLIIGEPVVEVFDDEIEEGKVVKTIPKAGEVAKEGSEIIIYTSKGKEKEELVNFIGQNIDEVKKQLQSKVKNIEERLQYSQDIPAGEIYDQYPKPGEFLLEETEVIFFISEGPAPFNLNNLERLTLIQVENYVSDKILILEKITKVHSEEFEEGLVITQNPAPGTQLKAGDSITVTVSLGPEEKPPKSVSREVTVLYEPIEEGKPQEVQIYVFDLDHNESNALVISEKITKDKKFKIDLQIPYANSATYRIERDGTVTEETTVTYEEE